MPVFKIQTNATVSKKSDFLKEASAFVAALLSKPESFVMVILDNEASMLFGGANDYTAMIELKSIGLPKDQTKDLSRKICAFIEKQLHIPSNRVYIEFTDIQRNMFGWNASNFER